MLPTHEQIQLAAYCRWERRGGGHGYDLADWLGAEQALILSLNYDWITYYFLDERKKQYIGDPKNRRCRYCGRSAPQVTFNLEAHAIPECIGNKSLIANDECDPCNTFFSETIEDSFGKLFLPMRTVFAISGKKGVPTYRDIATRFEFDPRTRGFNVKDLGDRFVFDDDEAQKRLNATLGVQPYVPVRVLKCFTKMALAIMPEFELVNFDLARQWVRNPDDTQWINYVRGAGCYVYHLRITYPRPWAILLRRRTLDTPLPYMLFALGVGNLLFQTHVRMTPENDLFVGQGISIPRVGSVAIPDGGEVTRIALPLDSPAVVRDTKLDIVIGYQSRHVAVK
jgi:hypothetical protein